MFISKNKMWFLLSLGIIFLFLSGYISQPLKTENYIFDLDATDSKIVHFNSFRLNYDFTLNSGSMTFNVDNKNNLEYITVDFPNPIRNIRYEIKSDEKIDNRIEKETYNNAITVVFSNFSKNHKYNITVYFQSNITPNAHFQIFSSTDRLIVYGDSPSTELTLGNKYSCIDRCFIPISGVEEHILSSPDIIKIKFKDGNKVYDNHRFKILAKRNYIFLPNIPEKELLWGLGVSFISAALISWINYNKPKTKSSKRNGKWP